MNARVAAVSAAAALAIAAPLALGGGTPSPGDGGDGGGDKVTICHLPPGNPSNVQIITVGRAAVRAHLRQHGDLLFVDGRCVKPKPKDPKK